MKITCGKRASFLTWAWGIHAADPFGAPWQKHRIVVVYIGRYYIRLNYRKGKCS